MGLTLRIDLNADLGEGYPHDEAILALVSSANIACGGHAGDELSMRESLALASRYGVNVGAHPSYPDKENFGRASMEISAADLLATLVQQIKALGALATACDAALTHVKPHGALYNDTMMSEALSEIVVEAVERAAPRAAVFGPPNSALGRSAARRGIPFLAEGFADRAYQAHGALVPRSVDGAVLEEPDDAAGQAVALAKGQLISSLNGDDIRIDVDTICLHGDDQGSLDRARAIKRALMAAGIEVQGFAT